MPNCTINLFGFNYLLPRSFISLISWQFTKDLRIMGQIWNVTFCFHWCKGGHSQLSLLSPMVQQIPIHPRPQHWRVFLQITIQILKQEDRIPHYAMIYVFFSIWAWTVHYKPHPHGKFWDILKDGIAEEYVHSHQLPFEIQQSPYPIFWVIYMNPFIPFSRPSRYIDYITYYISKPMQD